MNLIYRKDDKMGDFEKITQRMKDETSGLPEKMQKNLKVKNLSDYGRLGVRLYGDETFDELMIKEKYWQTSN